MRGRPAELLHHARQKVTYESGALFVHSLIPTKHLVSLYGEVPHGVDDAARKAVEALCWLEDGVVVIVLALDRVHVRDTVKQRAARFGYFKRPRYMLKEEHAVLIDLVDSVHIASDTSISCLQGYCILWAHMLATQEQTRSPTLFIVQEQPVLCQGLNPDIRWVEVVLVATVDVRSYYESCSCAECNVPVLPLACAFEEFTPCIWQDCNDNLPGRWLIWLSCGSSLIVRCLFYFH